MLIAPDRTSRARSSDLAWMDRSWEGEKLAAALMHYRPERFLRQRQLLGRGQECIENIAGCPDLSR